MKVKAPVQIAIGIVRNGDHILLLKRSKKEGNLSWVFPGGKIKPGETTDVAVIREVAEETNIQCKAVRLLQTKVHPDTSAMISYWLCEAVNTAAVNAEPDKATAVIWATPQEAESLITSTISDCVRKELGLS